MLKDKAIEYFKNGYSCSECIVQACIDAGMSSGCACGSITGSQLVLGYLYGRNNKFGNEISARQKAAEFVEEFKKLNKVTCCRILSSEFSGMDRKMHCSKFVADACDILEQLIGARV